MLTSARLWLGVWTAVLRLLTPLLLVRLFWRGLREPLYRQAWWQRLGLGLPRPLPGGVWVHAVSLGETRAAAALIEALRARQPGLRLVLTHGTATGLAAGRVLLREGDVQCWQPFDTPGAVRRFLHATQPALGLLMETEVWPQLLHGARRQGVPMVLANARLSERSLRKGLRLSALLRPAVQSLRGVLAQTEADAQRLVRAGASPVVVCGNLKFDMQPAPELRTTGQAWRAALAGAAGAEGPARAVVMAAATRDGEEALLLAAWRRARDAASAGAQARASGPAAPAWPLLLIVPRHPQRFEAVAELLQSQGWVFERRSAFAPAGPGAPQAQSAVWLGDSLGEMPLYYSLAEVALLGGSFAPLGGQNLIEALACGCPVVAGPHTFNFTEPMRWATQAGAAQAVADVDAGVAAALRWVNDHGARADASAQALALCALHRGAAARQATEALALRRH